MKIRNLMTTFILALAFAFSVTIADAAKEEVDLKGSGTWDKAKGQAVIDDSQAVAGQREVNIKASGLRPDSVYTAWLTSSERRGDVKSLGTQGMAVRSDKDGNIDYTASISEDELSRFDSVALAFHPDGNPANMDNVDIALEGELPEDMG